MNTPSEQQETGKLHNGKAHRYEFREQDRHTHPPIQKEKKKKKKSSDTEGLGSGTTGSGLKWTNHAEFNFCLCYANEALQVPDDLVAQIPAF